MVLPRRAKRWLIILVVIAAALTALKLGRNRIAKKVLARVAAIAEKGGYSFTFDDVEFALIQQHIRIEGLQLVPLDASLTDSAARFTVKAAAIDLLGVDMWAMLRDRTLHVGHVEVHAPQVERTFVDRPRTARTPKDRAEEHEGKGIPVIRLDTLLVSEASGRSVERSKADTTMVVASMDLLLTAISIGENAQGGPSFDLGTAQLAIRGVTARLEPYYTLRIDSMEAMIPENSAAIRGMHLIPDVSAATYHKEIKHQTELFEVNVGIISLEGFDLAAQLAEGAIHARRLQVSGAEVDIHRDKSVPMRPDPPRKPLLAERIQGWKRSVAIDTIVLKESRITYHERLVRNAPYGALTFAGINGRLTGVDNTAADGSTSIQLVGDARVWDKARAHIEMRMDRAQGPTRIEIAVRLRDLPATELNRMTDDLVHVSATEGFIHLVEMHMKGDDFSATGTVEEHYDSLYLELSPQMKYAGLLTFVANKVVRSHNMPGDKSYKVGRFNVRRRQEASVFNYLWLGLREGMMEVMLPDRLLKEIKKQQKKD